MRTSRRKELARGAVAGSGLNVPGFEIVDLGMPLDRQLAAVKYPCVAKPVTLSASRGVIRANDQDELLEAVERIRAILNAEGVPAGDRAVLVEDYIEGSEHALEGYLADGKLETICVFDKPDPLAGPYFEETYYVTPSRLADAVLRDVHRTIEKACGLYGLIEGPVHGEVRVNDQGVWLLEVAARTIGGDCARLFELVTDRGLEDFVLSRAIGKRVETFRFSGAAGVLMLPVAESGILRRIEGVSEAEEAENVLEVRIDVRSGEKLRQWPEGGKYPGFVYAQGSTPEEVELALRAAHARLNVVVMPEFPATVASTR